MIKTEKIKFNKNLDHAPLILSYDFFHKFCFKYTPKAEQMHTVFRILSVQTVAILLAKHVAIWIWLKSYTIQQSLVQYARTGLNTIS